MACKACNDCNDLGCKQIVYPECIVTKSGYSCIGTAPGVTGAVLFAAINASICTLNSSISSIQGNITTLQTQIAAIQAALPGMSAPTWVKLTVTYQDLAAAALTNDISIYSLPGKGIIQDCKVFPTTTFSGGSISSYNITIGTVAIHNAIHTNMSVFTASTGDLGVYVAGTTGVPSLSAATDIRLYATAVGDNLDQADQGSMDIYMLVATLP